MKAGYLEMDEEKTQLHQPQEAQQSQDYLARAKEVFEKDMFATKAAGIVIDEVKSNFARCSMPLTENHLNASGFCMGGAIFTLADYAFAIASNTEGLGTVSATSSIDFVRPAVGSVLHAQANCIKQGANLSFYEVTITNDADKIVAIVRITGFRKSH